MVDQLATDLTALAQDFALNPVIGRNTEIERVIQELGTAHQKMGRRCWQNCYY